MQTANRQFFVSKMGFREKLQKKWDEKKYVCIGLDPVKEKLPQGVSNFFDFNKQIIDATYDLVASYKPNSAFYEAYGAEGVEELKKTFDYIHTNHPDVVTILDAKRADIGNTNEGYIRFAFDYLGSDAITVHPYLGEEALRPFLELKDKGIIVLCKTSNEGSGEFQSFNDLYLKVAENVSKFWNKNGNCALVVGATYPDELLKIRKIAPKMPILIPGIGAQGGDLEATVKAAQENFIINSSRGIIFASNEEDFAEKASLETVKLQEQIREFIVS